MVNGTNIGTVIKEYRYNSTGDLVRKESYVNGEELTTGINIEEYVYNDKGYLLYSCSYNSLDTSSKIYKENELDENGITVSEYDASGEHKTVFKYAPDGVTVREESLPNGSKFSYGRDKNGNITAITHSTEDGKNIFNYDKNCRHYVL